MKALLVLALMVGVADARGVCHETSPIVGRRHCGGFGARWAHDPWIGIFGFELALAYEDMAIAGVDVHGTAYSATQSPSYHLTLAPDSRHHLHAFGPRLRIGYRAPHATFALEVTGGFSAVSSPTTVTAVDGFAPIQTTDGSLFDVAGVVGYHRRLDALQLGGEVAIGFRDALLSSALPPGFTTCAAGATGKRCYAGASDTQLLVEPRARVDWWLTPAFTVGASGGVDVAARGGSVSLILGWHSAAYDGS